MPLVELPELGITVRTVDREQLRARDLPRFAAPAGMAATDAPPATWDSSLGETVRFPMNGNDQYGDCFYVAAVNGVICSTASVGTPATFDRAALVARYLAIAGGDNGLYDAILFPEFKAGVVGPNGPHRAVDIATLDPADEAAHRLAIWRFNYTMWTCSLPGGWARTASPGVVWDADGSQSVGGHAMVNSGYRAPGRFDVRTWAVSPCIQVTQRGILANDPEVIVVFSAENYDAKTRLSRAGFTWEQDAALWKAWTGRDVGPAPWGPTPPPVPPVPPTPGDTFTGTLTVRDGIIRSVGGVAPDALAPLAAAGWSVADLVRLLELVKQIADLFRK